MHASLLVRASLVLLVGCAACSPEQEARAKERFEIERERAKQGLERAAETLEQEAAALRAKLAAERGEAAEQWRRALEDVEARKAQAKEKLARLADVGADAWEELRTGFERAAEELQRARVDPRNPVEPEPETGPTQR